jgi:pimeloyl-ACP methyl ester carboxylesterase
MTIPAFPLTRFALSTGVSINAVDIGPRDGEVLIFLHGFPESHRTWRHQLTHLSTRYRCIAPDQRGYCQSDKPDGVENYSVDKLTADIFALADACGVDRFTIVGHDWGGAIAWSVALNGMAGAPQDGRVQRTIIANAPHPFIFQKLLLSNMEQRAASQYMRAFRDPANDALVAEQGIAGILRAALDWERSTAMEPAEAAQLLTDWQEPGAAMAMLNWYRASPITVPAMEDVVPPIPADVRFPVLTSPTLVIWAMDDLALPSCNLDGMADLIRDLTVEPISGCGHFVPWEAPDKVNAAMASWLAAHPLG